MSENIQAIETVYNGYRFRSRLEARWAVFFDAADIKYQYELEGFHLKASEWIKVPECDYLPDFFLPEFNVFVEIKPDREHDDKKAIAFSDQYTSFQDEYGGIIICYGDPMEEDCEFHCNSMTTDDYGGSYDGKGIFAHNYYYCNDNPIFMITDDHRCDRVFHITTDRVCLSCNMPSGTGFLTEAKTFARRARFEHGETPDPNNFGTRMCRTCGNDRCEKCFMLEDGSMRKYERRIV